MTKPPATRNAAVSVPLECGDTLWFKVAVPQYGEKVWCQHCHEYVTVGQPSHVTTLGFFPDYMWTCEKDAAYFHGRCVYDPACGYGSRDRNWTRLKKTMELHHLRSHTNSALVFAEVERKRHGRQPSDATPPF